MARTSQASISRRYVMIFVIIASALVFLSSSGSAEVTNLAPTPVSMSCPSSGGHVYQTSGSEGKVDCNFDMSNCNNNPPFLWGPADGTLLQVGDTSAPCFGNLISGATAVSSFSYTLGLYAEGELPLDDETQAYIVRTSDGTILDSANLLNLESINDTDTYTSVRAEFSPPVALDPSSVYALFFCYVSNASQHSDIYAANLFQSTEAGAPTRAASCLQYDDSTGDFPCFTSFDHAAQHGILNEFAMAIEYDCQIVVPAASQSATPSASATSSPSPSRSASSSSASPTPSRSPIPVPSVQPVPNVEVKFDATTPKVTLSSDSAEHSVSTGFGGISSGGAVVQGSTAPGVPVTSADGSTTKINYKTTFANGETLDLAFEFHKKPAVQSFAGTEFTVPAGASKWTVTMQSWPFGNATSIQAFNVTNTVAVADGEEITEVRVQRNTPQADMTTFTVLTKSNLAVKLETFDVVEIDGQIKPIVAVNAVPSKSKKSQLDLTLTFPRFATSLNYDPNVYMVTVEQASSSASTLSAPFFSSLASSLLRAHLG